MAEPVKPVDWESLAKASRARVRNLRYEIGRADISDERKEFLQHAAMLTERYLLMAENKIRTLIGEKNG